MHVRVYSKPTRVWNVCTNVGLLMLHTSAESVFTEDIRTLYLHMYILVSTAL